MQKSEIDRIVEDDFAGFASSYKIDLSSESEVEVS